MKLIGLFLVCLVILPFPPKKAQLYDVCYCCDRCETWQNCQVPRTAEHGSPEIVKRSCHRCGGDVRIMTTDEMFDRDFDYEYLPKPK